jgi:hypothetical protein
MQHTQMHRNLAKRRDIVIHVAELREGHTQRFDKRAASRRPPRNERAHEALIHVHGL